MAHTTKATVHVNDMPLGRRFSNYEAAQRWRMFLETITHVARHWVECYNNDGA